MCNDKKQITKIIIMRTTNCTQHATSLEQRKISMTDDFPYNSWTYDQLG